MSKPSIMFYHNPRCSKSRAALGLLEAEGVAVTVVEYLKHPLDAAALRALVAKLAIAPSQLLRTDETVFKEKYSGRELSDAECIRALAADPILMQRPIAVRGDKAVIGRPPENVLAVLR